MVQLRLHYVTIPGQVPLILAVPTLDRVGLASNRYLTYNPLVNVVSTNPYGNFTPPFDLYDPRFNIPEDTDIFFTSDIEKSEALIIVFLPELDRVYMGTPLRGKRYSLYTKVSLVRTQQPDGSMSYKFNFRAYNPNPTHAIIDHYLIEIQRLNLFEKPNGFTFDIDVSSHMEEDLQRQLDNATFYLGQDRNRIASLQAEINQLNNGLITRQRTIDQLTARINSIP